MTRASRIFLIFVAVLAPSAGADDDADESTAADPPDRVVNDRCPVMTEEFTSPLHEIQTHGMTVRFCCAKCRRRFESDPVPYLAHLPQVTPAAAQAILADAAGTAGERAARAEDRFDRWMRPLMLAAAGGLTAWLVVRIFRRRQKQSSYVTQTPPAE